MSGTQLAGIAGALTGAGVMAAAYPLLPPAPFDIASTLELRAASDRSRTGIAGEVLGWFLSQTAARPWLLGASRRDLALLNRPVDRFVLDRLTWTAVGLALPGLVWAVGSLLGVALPAALPALAGILAAVGLSMVPVLVVRTDAARARAEFRASVCAYLDLVAQARAAGHSPTQALTAAAQVSRGWVFTRIRTHLAHAARAGVAPWQALADLAVDVGVTELADLAAIVETAADGAAIYMTLTKKAASLRTAVLAEAQATANARSERLILPVTLLTLGFLMLVFYPTIVSLLTP